MASKSLRKKIARKIAEAEKVIQYSQDKHARQVAEEEIMKLTEEHNLNIIDLLEIDDMIQNMLNK
jgi:uncharacterized protein (UPF0212 family)